MPALRIELWECTCGCDTRGVKAFLDSEEIPSEQIELNIYETYLIPEYDDGAVKTVSTLGDWPKE